LGCLLFVVWFHQKINKLKKVLTYYNILCYIIFGYDDNQKESEIK